jgi:hypothetical protein
MSVEGIEECLAIAEHSVTARKTNGGIYGFPAVLLLFCIVDALSVNTGARAHSLQEITSIIPGLTEKQIRNLRRWYRDLLVHQAVIAPGTLLSDSDGCPIEFNSRGEPTHIRVVPFYQAVKSRWESFNQSTLNPKVHRQNGPTTPMATTHAPSITGCQHTMSVK